MTRQLMQYVTGYHSKILVPTDRVTMDDYKVQSGMCKYTQYWNVVPGREAEYIDFMQNEFVPGMEKLAHRWRTDGAWSWGPALTF